MQAGLEGTRTLIIDPHAALDRSAGAGARSSWDGELCEYEEELRKHDLDVVAAFDGWLVVDPQSLDQAVIGRRVSRILRMVWALRQPCTVVLEEAGLYSRYCIEVVNLLATSSGHNRLRLVLIAQSLGRITIDARRNASHLVLWSQSDPQDYAELRAKLGKVGIAKLSAMRPGDPPVTWRQGEVGQL